MATPSVLYHSDLKRGRATQSQEKNTIHTEKGEINKEKGNNMQTEAESPDHRISSNNKLFVTLNSLFFLRSNTEVGKK